MSKFKLAIAATVASLVTVPMAQAAPYEFGGVYVGAHAGYLDLDADFSGGSDSGTMGGMQAGYNVVNGNLLWGFEFDVSLTEASACCSINTRMLGTIRPRVGYAVDDWLIYATGGLASVQFEEFDGFDGSFGWTLGAGVEHMLGDIIGIKLEYRYMQFDDVEQGIKSPAGKSPIDFDMHTVMGGVNVHF